MYIYIYIYTYTLIHIYTYTYAHTHIHTPLSLCMYVYIHIYIYIYNVRVCYSAVHSCLNMCYEYVTYHTFMILQSVMCMCYVYVCDMCYVAFKYICVYVSVWMYVCVYSLFSNVVLESPDSGGVEFEDVCHRYHCARLADWNGCDIEHTIMLRAVCECVCVCVPACIWGAWQCTSKHHACLHTWTAAHLPVCTFGPGSVLTSTYVELEH